MVSSDGTRAVTVFVSTYLLLSLPPFLLLNPEAWDAVSEFAWLAILGTLVLVAISWLVIADEGVERYVGFLFGPWDILSVILDLSFVVAAISWWAIPGVTEYYELSLTLETLLGAILIAHIPMILFLSLLTAIGEATPR